MSGCGQKRQAYHLPLPAQGGRLGSLGDPAPAVRWEEEMSPLYSERTPSTAIQPPQSFAAPMESGGLHTSTGQACGTACCLQLQASPVSQAHDPAGRSIDGD